jgi:antibiotic biosynthesis monooxygenase (ABM) superfamily enzyme
MLDTREFTADATEYGELPAHIDGGGAGNTGGHPAKWKFWVLTMIGLYPLLTALVMVTAPILEPLPTPLRLACIMPVAVASMVWVIMPMLSRCFAGWLSD